jgi:hypothetical protein
MAGIHQRLPYPSIPQVTNYLTNYPIPLFLQGVHAGGRIGSPSSATDL